MEPKPRRQTIYWDIEPAFLYDYLIFGSYIRECLAIEIDYTKYRMDEFGSAACFINLFEAYQKSLEDVGAFCLALKRRFHRDPKCKYQNEFSVSETPIMFTLINYPPKEAKIIDIIGKTKDEVEKNLNLGIINEINFKSFDPNFDYPKWKNDFIKVLRGSARDQENRLKMYNKIKHGGIIISDIRIFLPSKPAGLAAIFKNPDDPLDSKCFKYSGEEFNLLKEGIKKSGGIIRDLVNIYLAKYYSEFLISMGHPTPLEIFDQDNIIKLRQGNGVAKD